MNAEDFAPAGPQDDDEAVPERDPRAELNAARRKCTPKMRKMLSALARHNYQPYAAGIGLGFSKRTIQKFLRDPKFKAALVLLDEVAVDDLCITNRRILQEYAYIAFSRVARAYDEKGELLKPSGWPEDVSAAISGVDTEERFEGRGEERETYTTRKVRVHPKSEALKALAQYKRMISELHELTGANGEPLNTAPPVVNVIISKKD